MEAGSLLLVDACFPHPSSEKHWVKGRREAGRKTGSDCTGSGCAASGQEGEFALGRFCETGQKLS